MDFHYRIDIYVEPSLMQGEKTLFVFGNKPVADILSLAAVNNISHIYLGDQQSFSPANNSEWQEWDNIVVPLLKKGLWVSLEFDVSYSSDVHEGSWCEFNNFIPVINIKLPYIQLFNYNAIIRIDDDNSSGSNPGVWTQYLHNVLSHKNFTPWKKLSGKYPIQNIKTNE